MNLARMRQYATGTPKTPCSAPNPPSTSAGISACQLRRGHQHGGWHYTTGVYWLEDGAENNGVPREIADMWLRYYGNP